MVTYIAFLERIRLANTLAYYAEAKVIVVKSFIGLKTGLKRFDV